MKRLTRATSACRASLMSRIAWCGRNAIREHAASQGIELPEDVLQLVTAQVKLMADERPITLEDVDGILTKMMMPIDD